MALTSRCSVLFAVVGPCTRAAPQSRVGDSFDSESSRAPSNDRTIREAIWRRFDGDEWAAFDQLPTVVRQRLTEHAYDAWSVNALVLWRHYRRLYPTADRAVRGLLRYLDHCERLERQAFAADYVRRHGIALPHVAAGIPVLRAAPGQQPVLLP